MVGFFSGNSCVFAVTYFLSARPNKIVDIIGKYLTPILILSIVAIFFSCLFMDKSNHTIQYGATTASDAYSSGGAFFQGLVEGYNALDGPAGLVFAIIIINAVTGFGIKKRKKYYKVYRNLRHWCGYHFIGNLFYVDLYWCLYTNFVP